MKHKIIIAIVSIAVLLMSNISIHADTTPTISVGQVTADFGATVAVPITISDNTGICGATISIDYDERLVLTSIDKGSAFSNLSMTKPGNLSGNPFNLVWDGMEADSSNGTLATLTFLLPNEPGTFNINASYDYGDIVDGDLVPVNVMINSGSITVGNSGEGGGDTPENNDDVIISVESQSANSGGSITVPIKIANNNGICGATISVAYDNRLTLTSVNKGEALSTLSMTKPGNLSSNPVRIVWDGMEADASNGVLATLTFTVPHNTGTYFITLSYDDGDIVDGDLTPVEPILQRGYIAVSSSYGGSSTVVTVAEQSVTLIGQNNNGRILVAFYKSNGAMIELKTFDVASNIDAGSVINATKAKVFWWESMNGMKPVCNAKVIEIE
ncbi:MAG: hypothetical protein E7389_04340 [Ruminococcaceae bacterium]|nr:hypothetical protein [Oscillospiraceae bacterium]